MKIKDLVEAETGGKHITFCFGRMNPPTIGHEQVFKTMADVGGDYKIFVSQTQDKKENPLDYATKTKFIKLIHPKYADHLVVDPRLNTIGKVCSYLYDLGYRDATFVAGSDRLASFQQLISDYNGVEGKAHGYYKFEVLDFKSSGEREDGAEGVKGVSASKAREKAVAGDLKGFAEKTGAGQYAEELYHAVRKGMGVKESMAAEGFDDEEKDYNDLFGYKPLDKLYADELKRAFDADIKNQPDIVARRFVERDGNTYKYRVRLRDGSEHDMFLTHEHGTIEAWIDESVAEGLKSKIAGAALAAANLLGSPAQAAEEPVKPITIAYVMIDGEVRKYNLGDKFSSAKEAEKFISGVLSKQGLQGYTLDIKHGYPKKKDSDVKEAPLEMDPADPMDPMIHSHDKANPAKLKYRMLRAAGQLKDLASRAENASPGEWQLMARQFEELKMNMEQIRHALEELGKKRKKGGIGSRGIDPMLDSIEEGYGRYYCSTDKKWKTRKGPKQKRSS